MCICLIQSIRATTTMTIESLLLLPLLLLLLVVVAGQTTATATGTTTTTAATVKAYENHTVVLPCHVEDLGEYISARHFSSSFFSAFYIISYERNSSIKPLMLLLCCSLVSFCISPPSTFDGDIYTDALRGLIPTFR